jgi:hypothetical protein
MGVSMNFSHKNKIFGLLALFILCNKSASSIPSLSYESTEFQGSRQPSTCQTGNFLKTLGIGIAESFALTYLTTKVMSLTEPLGQQLDETLFSGAKYIVPGVLALGSYELKEIAKRKERLAEIKHGEPSTFWTHTKFLFSSATRLIALSTLTGALGSRLSEFYQTTGSKVAMTCNALAPTHTTMCSYVADKTAAMALTATSLAATKIAEALSPHDAPPLRVKKNSFIPQTTQPRPSTNEPQIAKTTSSKNIELEGPQITYFLAKYGYDIETLWGNLLTQSKQLKESKRGNWQKFCEKQLLQLRQNISDAFDVAAEKLPTVINSTITDVVHGLMPFSTYPLKYKLHLGNLAKEQPSFSCTAAKNPKDIFEGLKTAVLSYFDPINLEKRNSKGDDACFNCPITPIFLEIKDKEVTILAYPQSRQDLLYPYQFEKTTTLPKWLRVASSSIPYALILGQILYSKPSGYFLPDGTLCMPQNGQMYCSNGEAIQTQCASTFSCIREISTRITSKQQQALIALGLDLRGSYSMKQIDQRYKHLALKYHPDKCKPTKECAEKFMAIAKARKLLEQTMNI